LSAHQKNPPNFGALEKKYRNEVEKMEAEQDQEYIDSQEQASIERKRKS
jgi:hypothetical protein